MIYKVGRFADDCSWKLPEEATPTLASESTRRIRDMFEEHINLGEHGIKLYHDGWLIVYETPTGGDCVLLLTAQTHKLFAFLEEHDATFQGEELETVGVNPYYRELSCYPDGHFQTRPAQLTIQGELTLKEGATTIALKKQEVASLYNFLIAHRETFQKNSSAHRTAA